VSCSGRATKSSRREDVAGPVPQPAHRALAIHHAVRSGIRSRPAAANFSDATAASTFPDAERDQVFLAWEAGRRSPLVSAFVAAASR